MPNIDSMYLPNIDNREQNVLPLLPRGCWTSENSSLAHLLKGKCPLLRNSGSMIGVAKLFLRGSLIYQQASD